MQMLMLTFRQSLEEAVQDILKDLNVKGFTQMSRVSGMGQTGAVPREFSSPGLNAMLFAAMEDDQIRAAVDRFRAFCEEHMKRQSGAKVPLRAFVIPCEQVL